MFYEHKSNSHQVHQLYPTRGLSNCLHISKYYPFVTLNMDDSGKTMDQVGPCGVICWSCPLGRGVIADSATKTRGFIKDYKIPMWAPNVPGGEAIDWDHMDKGLEWMEKFARCFGCGMGGGPPDCTIRTCARERGYELCTLCDDLDSCTNFDWLKDKGSQIKDLLRSKRGMTKDEYVKSMGGCMPWDKQ